MENEEQLFDHFLYYFYGILDYHLQGALTTRRINEIDFFLQKIKYKLNENYLKTLLFYMDLNFC